MYEQNVEEEINDKHTCIDMNLYINNVDSKKPKHTK